MDSIEQKIDKLMVMMGKLVTEDEGQNRQFKPWIYQSNRGRGQMRWITNRDFRAVLGQTAHTEEDQGMDKIIQVGQDMILIIEVLTETIWEVIENMGDRIIIIEGETLEIKIMIGIGVGHMRDRTETEGTIEALVIVDQDQVQRQLQIGID